MMEPWLNTLITVFCAVLASSGLWAYLEKRSTKKDAKTQLLIGIAHDRIITLGTQYIERGDITLDELENLNSYLYKPYIKLGGNGSAKRLMDEVLKLPIRC